MSWWVSLLLAVGVGLLLSWLVLAAAVLRGARSRSSLTDAVRLLPDLLRLLSRLARDGSLPRGVRVRLWLLLAYLAMPFDLIPDFIPVIGYADDALRHSMSARCGAPCRPRGHREALARNTGGPGHAPRPDRPASG